MSIGYIRTAVLKCDSCGTRKTFGRLGEMAARLVASREGWRYAIYLNVEATKEDAAPRRYGFDACPGCKLPGTLQPLEITIGAV